MPSQQEKDFFRRAFQLIDRERRTRWYDIYILQVSQSPDGRVDWGLLPGFIPENHSGYGYIKAVKRLAQILLEIFQDAPADERLQEKLGPLALLAKSIYEFRLRALVRHGDEETGDSGHAVACNVWKEVAQTLAPQDEEIVQMYQQPTADDTRLKAILVIGIAVCLGAAAWFLINRFLG